MKERQDLPVMREAFPTGGLSNHRRSWSDLPLLWSLLLGGLAWWGALAAHAGPAMDPFLERFRVGCYRDPESIELQDGWPADLLLPPAMDSLWCRAAEQYFAPAELPRPHGQLTWRLLGPALGSADAQRSWYRQRRCRLADVLSGRTLTLAEADTCAGEPFLLATWLAASAFAEHARGDFRAAAALAGRLLEDAGALDLSDEEFFVWSLRRWAWLQMAGDGPSAAEETIWPELLELGPYDMQSAWAIWTARRRAADQPLLPPGTSSALVRCIGGLSRTWLRTTDLAGAALDSSLEEALGAASLPVGPELAAHLDRYRQPPAATDLQWLWIQGHRRQADYRPAATESLAARSDLHPVWRVDLWRRAAEAQLIAGRWETGLTDLRQAVAGMSGLSTNRQERIGTAVLQAVVLARARGRQEAARRLLALAEKALPEEQKRAVNEALALMEQQEADSTTPTALPLPELARRVVAGGRACELQGGPTPDLLARARQLREELLAEWAAWGLALIAGSPTESSTAGCQGYRWALAAVQEAETGAARLAMACAAVGGRLRDHPGRQAVLESALRCDLTTLAPGVGPSAPSPLSQLARSSRVGSLAGRLDLHCLLGAALLLHDETGQVTAALRLPRGRYPAERRLRFLYPLPGDDRLLQALARAQVEAPMMLALVRNESLFEPAIRSRAGALGWCQVMPFHLPERGLAGGSCVWRDPVQSLAVGARLLADSRTQFKGDPYRALAAYNAGARAVRRWDRQLGGQADRASFLVWIGYPETRRYVEKVLIDRELYAWILGERKQAVGGR
jgi:hypothetical protein